MALPEEIQQALAKALEDVGVEEQGDLAVLAEQVLEKLRQAGYILLERGTERD